MRKWHRGTDLVLCAAMLLPALSPAPPALSPSGISFIQLLPRTADGSQLARPRPPSLSSAPWGRRVLQTKTINPPSYARRRSSQSITRSPLHMAWVLARFRKCYSGQHAFPVIVLNRFAVGGLASPIVCEPVSSDAGDTSGQRTSACDGALGTGHGKWGNMAGCSIG